LIHFYKRSKENEALKFSIPDPFNFTSILIKI